MVQRGTGVLLDAWKGGWALGAFSVYDVGQARAVADAAARSATPVLLQAGSSAFRAVGQEVLAAVALAVAEASPGAVGVHLDHATDLDEIAACLDAGYSSVMFDGSALPFEDNVRVTRQVVEQAHAVGAWVEGELVGVAGEEDRSSSATRAAGLTDPDRAAWFVERTGVDALAVAIGNVHGLPAEPVVLDLDRLAEIHARVPVPLVLHGASGLADEDVRAAIGLGVAKINVNAELRRSYLAALRRDLASRDDDDLAAVLCAASDAVADTVDAKVAVYGGPGRPANAATEQVA